MFEGCCHKPFLGGEWRAGAGFTPLALDGGHQGGFLTADESACAHPDFQIEGETCAEDVFTQKAQAASLIDGYFHGSDSYWVFSPAVDIALVRTGGIRADDHAFNNGMGVTFEDAPVGKRTGVAFVSVADHEFLFAFCPHE